jgi:hypothetical protein
VIALLKGRKDIVTREFIESIQVFREGISRKPEVDRTKREELIVEACKTLEELLHKYESHSGGGDARRQAVDESVLTVMRSYNEINREHDLVDVDLEMASILRKGRGKGNGSK